MRNKRIIWLLVILVFVLFGGGLSFAATRQTFHCPIELKESPLIRHFLYLFQYNQIINEMIRTAKEAEEDPSKWKKVVVEYCGDGWLCEVYEETPRGLEPTAGIHLQSSDWSGQMWFIVIHRDPIQRLDKKE